jgi:hypothetical protein
MSRPLMRYHPRIGFTYMPGTKLRVQSAHGGYLVRTNTAGFRSEREFARERTPGKRRVLLFGDSQTAGDGTSNALRFSDLLEQSLPGVEVFNHALSGTGTDQQYLTYQEFGAPLDHDLVVVGLYVENILRLTARVLRIRDLAGDELLRAKPYFELGAQGLVLHGVPVPKQAWTEDTLPPELAPYVFTYGNEFSMLREPAQPGAALLRKLIPEGPFRDAARSLVAKVRKFEPMPPYHSPTSPEWLLMRAILSEWVRASSAPVLLVLLPHPTALAPAGDLRTSDPSAYQARFRELARDTGCAVYDPLPDLLAMSEDERSELIAMGHLSVQGHRCLARLLTPVLARQLQERPAAPRSGVEDALGAL